MNPSLALSFPRNIPFNNSRDIETALQTALVANFVQDKVTQSREINISEAMRSLTQVGKLLQLAYAGSKGFPCSKQVAQILLDYQSLIKDSKVTSGTFVKCCLAALRLHKAALTFAEKENTNLALKQMVSCGELANTMVEDSKKLVAQSTALSNLAKVALLSAIDDSNATAEKKQQVQKMIDALEASKASLTSKVSSLQQIIDENHKKEELALKEAKEARKQSFLVSLISSIAQPIVAIGGAVARGVMAVSSPGSAVASAASAKVSEELEEAVKKNAQEKVSIQNRLNDVQRDLAAKEVALKNADEQCKNAIEQECAVLKSDVNRLQQELQQKEDVIEKIQRKFDQHVKDAEDRARAYMQLNSEFVREKIEANASLSESITKLKNMATDKQDLTQAINSLELTIKTMGKVRTVFENTRIFWEGVKAHCEALTSRGVDASVMIDYAHAGMKEEFIDALSNSAFNWLAFGKNNLIAANAVEAVDLNVDVIMNDLPDPSEAAELIQSLSDSILLQIREEQTQLQISNN